MMAPEHRESMQKGHAPSSGCFQGKSFFHGPHCPRSSSFFHDTKQVTPDTNKTDGSKNTDKLEFSNECCGRPAHHENYYIWSTLPPNYLKEIHNQSNHFDGCIHPGNHGQYFPTHWFPQPPFPMIPQSYPPEYGFQDFQYFVVIDFEATCDKEKKPHPQEIIEFPSVLVNSKTGQLEDCFQIYVRPTHNQMLSDFCKELTGIQQSQVDEGVLLSEALFMHDKWLEEKGIKHVNFAVVTWSNWDCKVMLESECRFKRIRKPPYFNRWINLKVPFCEAFSGVRCNLKDAVELAGLTWQGRAHCGLDDAKNTARLLAHLMHCGLKLSITGSILWQSAGEHGHLVHQNQPNIRPNPYGLTYQVQAHQKYKSPSPSFFTTLLPFQPQVVVCYCGAVSVKRVVRKPGPQHGSFFFGCGNWTVNRGASCSFFKWVSSDYESPTETGTGT